MELHQLRYFECVARHESISRAADELHMTQPALSKSIAKLEEELGVKLFTREGKRISLNDRGAFFQRSVDRILHDLDDSAQSLIRLTENLEGNLRIGVFGPQQGAIACMVGFMLDNPGVRVTLDSRQSSGGRYLAREYDVLFFSEGFVFDEVSGVPFAASRMKVCVPESHALAERESVFLSELKDDFFIFTNTSTGVYEQCYQLCIDSGFYPTVRAIVSSGVAQISMIRAGLGVGLVDGLVGENEAPGVVTLDLNDNVPDRMLCIASAPFEGLSPIARRFVEYAFYYFGIPLDDRAKARLSGN